MKVTNYEEFDNTSQITVVNGDETLYFEDQVEFDEDLDEYSVCRLMDYRKDNGDGTELEVRGSYYNYFLHCLHCENKNFCRTLYIDEYGCVYEDTINDYGDTKNNEHIITKEFQNVNLFGRVELKEYLANSPKLFMSKEEEIFTVDILGDEHFERFLELDQKYSDVIGDTLMYIEKDRQEFFKKVCKKVQKKIKKIN